MEKPSNGAISFLLRKLLPEKGVKEKWYEHAKWHLSEIQSMAEQQAHAPEREREKEPNNGSAHPNWFDIN